MILQLLPQINCLDIVLASASPRRREILQSILGLKIRVEPSTFAEDLDKSLFEWPSQYIIATATGKITQVLSKLINQVDGSGETLKPPDMVISADTVIVLQSCVDPTDWKILEKPKTAADATSMLRLLASTERSPKEYRHFVLTAVVIKLRQPTGDPNLWLESHFTSETDVVFDASVSDDCLEAYVTSKQPFDKAGGYGIQESAAAFIKEIHGCYFNVMGFPLHDFCHHLSSLPIQPLLHSL